MIWSTWWVWLVAAGVFGILEALTPIYAFLGLAIGAALMGVSLLLFPTVLPTGLPFLLLIWAVLSLLAWVVLRLWLGSPRGEVKYWDRDIND